MHYDLSCLPLNNNRPITLNGQDYPTLSECPDWVDGVIARTAYAYVAEAARHNTPVHIAQRRIHDITGQSEAFGCYLALALLEMEDEDQVADYVITAINDLSLKSNVQFAYSNIIENFHLSGYLSYARKSPQMVERLEFLRKSDTHSILTLSIAFDDVTMAKRLVEQANHDFEYTLSYLGSVIHFPFRDSKVRNFLVSRFDDIRDQEIHMRLEMQKAISGGRMTAHDYATKSIDKAEPYAAYDFRTKSVLDLKPMQTPGFDQWLNESRANLDTLAKYLNYSSASRFEGRALDLAVHFEQALGMLMENMPVDQVYMQACMNYSPQKVELARKYHKGEFDLHRKLVSDLLTKLRDKDPLSNRIAKGFIDSFGLTHVLNLVEKQEDFLVIAKHIKHNLVLQRLTHEQRDSLMGHDVGL